MKTQTQLLLLEDVDNVGRKGDLVKVRPGYARNFLVPQQIAVVATKEALNRRAKLQQARANQAVVDKEESDQVALSLKDVVLSIEVKVDPEGHMYGSVGAGDIVELFAQQGLTMDKRFIQLAHPIKKSGIHTLSLRLKEGVLATCTLKVIPEGQTLDMPEEVAAEGVQAEQSH